MVSILNCVIAVGMKSDLNWLLSSIRTTNLSLFLWISVTEYFYFLLDGMFILLLRLQDLIYSKMSNAFIFPFFPSVYFKCNYLRKTVKKKKSDQHNVCLSIRIKTS